MCSAISSWCVTKTPPLRIKGISYLNRLIVALVHSPEGHNNSTVFPTNFLCSKIITEYLLVLVTSDLKTPATKVKNPTIKEGNNELLVARYLGYTAYLKEGRKKQYELVYISNRT